MPSEATPTNPEGALASLAELRSQSDVLGRHETQISAVKGS